MVNGNIPQEHPEAPKAKGLRWVTRATTIRGPHDVHIHDVQQGYASRAPALGEGLAMIGRLPGHTQVQTTPRDAHLTRDSIQNIAARITESIGKDLALAA